MGSKDLFKNKRSGSVGIKSITGYKGKVIYNKKYPDGVKKRKLDARVLDDLGWKAKIKIKQGLREYYNYFLKAGYRHIENGTSFFSVTFSLMEKNI